MTAQRTVMEAECQTTEPPPMGCETKAVQTPTGQPSTTGRLGCAPIGGIGPAPAYSQCTCVGLGRQSTARTTSTRWPVRQPGTGTGGANRDRTLPVLRD
jgi:hypothetical protein